MEHEQRRFLIGYEFGISGVNLPGTGDEFIWLGFSFGHIERLRSDGLAYRPRKYSIRKLLWNWLCGLTKTRRQHNVQEQR